MKRIGLLIALAIGLFLTGSLQAKTPLTVYTAVEADELAGFKKAFESQVKDVEIKWVRNSTGIITSRLIAEKSNPKADVVWGLAVTSLGQLAAMDYFIPYEPEKVSELAAGFVDKNKPPRWVGQRAWISSVCFNKVEAKKKNIPVPTSWQDLAKPIYKGQIVMPNPNSSGTGYLSVSSWIQMWGEKKAWDFMSGIHNNIAMYTHSGSKPCRMAAAGEYVVGISFAYRAAKLIKKGAPIALVSPKEGLGWDLESFAIVKGTKNLQAAKKFANWSVSPAAHKIYNKGYAVIGRPSLAKPVEHFPANIDKLMIKNDFEWSSKNRSRILTEWQKRFSSKSEPKG